MCTTTNRNIADGAVFADHRALAVGTKGILLWDPSTAKSSKLSNASPTSSTALWAACQLKIAPTPSRRATWSFGISALQKSCSASETTVDGRSYDVFGQRTIFKPEPDRLINQGGGEADFHLLGLCGIWFAIIEQPLPTHSRLCGQHNYLHSYLGHFCETNPIWLTDGARSWMTPNLEELQLMI